MTEDATASTSSAETEPSRPWPEVARLGELIADDLGLREAVDTLSRWMAHRTAELMARADNGDEAAAHEASELILELWSRRSDWREGWPPPRSAHAIERLAKAAEPVASHSGSRERELVPSEDPWLEGLLALSRLLGDELEIWRRLALARMDIDAELGKAAAVDPEISEEERRALRNLALLKDIAERHFQQALEGELTDAARIDLSRKEIEQLERSRRALFEAAAAATLGTDTRKTSDENNSDS